MLKYLDQNVSKNSFFLIILSFLKETIPDITQDLSPRIFEKYFKGYISERFNAREGFQ